MSPKTRSLAQQHLQLRQQLHQQRRLIAQRLEPDTASAVYPRSLTMGFLINRPVLTTQLLGQAATLVLGGRLIRSLGIALVVARLAHTLLRKHPEQ